MYDEGGKEFLKLCLGMIDCMSEGMVEANDRKGEVEVSDDVGRVRETGVQVGVEGMLAGSYPQQGANVGEDSELMELYAELYGE